MKTKFLFTILSFLLICSIPVFAINTQMNQTAIESVEIIDTIDPVVPETALTWSTVESIGPTDLGKWEYGSIAGLGSFVHYHDVTGHVFSTDSTNQTKFAAVGAQWPGKNPVELSACGTFDKQESCFGDAFLRISYTVVPLTTVSSLPSFRLRVNRGGDREWENYDQTTVVPRNMTANWNVGEPRTFSMIIRTNEYPINAENSLRIFFDVIAVKDTAVSGALKLTNVEISRSNEVRKSQNLSAYNFSNSQSNWTMQSSVSPLDPVSVTWDKENGLMMKTISAVASTNGVTQFGYLAGPHQLNFTQSNRVYAFNAFFSKIIPTGCTTGAYIRMRLNSEDWAYGHEKGYYLNMHPPYPVDSSDPEGMPLQLYVDQTSARELTSNLVFMPFVDLINSNPATCPQTGLSITQATMDRYGGFKPIITDIESIAANSPTGAAE